MVKTTDKTTKKFTSRMQANLLLVFCIVTLMLIGLMGRLIYLLQTKGDTYAKQVLSRETYVSSVLPYKRGDILDRNGTVLARSELQYKLIIDPMRLNDNPDCITATIAALVQSFGVEEEKIRVTLEEKASYRYSIVKKNIQYDEVEAFKALMSEDKSIIGVWFEEEYVRSYPYKTVAGDVIGFSSIDNIGYYGIEEYYNSELNGTNGREYGYYNSDLNIERIIKKAENGNSIISTIDVNAQRIIQKHITQFNTEYGSENIGVLVMDPNNGEIIAMASNQEYDLNNPRDLTGIYSEAELSGMTDDEKMNTLNTLWKNDVIGMTYEPGSTFKPITVSAGLEENIIMEDDTFFCDGKETFSGLANPIRCSSRSGHGLLTVGEALMYSCNDSLMQIAAKEGRDVFYEYQSRFGFGKKTGIDLPGEEAGITRTAAQLNPVELATSSFGQGINVTMLQLAAAYSSLVNGGSYYQPHVVKKIMNDNGATVKEFGKLLVRQTVSEKTSDFIQKYMYKTVEEGTAKGAKVEGYSVGGKTGTAQKLPRTDKTYIVSFLGEVPAVNPDIVIYVMIDEPQNFPKQADSSIATKFASRIMTELLPALGIYPEGEIDYLLSDEEDTTAQEENSQNQEKENNASETENANESSGEESTNQSTENNASAAGQEENGADTPSEEDEFNPDALE